MNGVTRLQVTEEEALVSYRKVPLSPEVLADIFLQFSGAGINIDMISQTCPAGDRVDISFTCPDADMVKVLGISKALGEKHDNLRPMVISGNCKVQLFGEEMRDTPGVFARSLSCMAKAGVELLQITTSEVDISLLMEAHKLADAVSALTKEFSL